MAHAFQMASLDLDHAVLDRSAGPTSLLQCGEQRRKVILLFRQSADDRNDLPLFSTNNYNLWTSKFLRTGTSKRLCPPCSTLNVETGGSLQSWPHNISKKTGDSLQPRPGGSLQPKPGILCSQSRGSLQFDFKQ